MHYQHIFLDSGCLASELSIGGSKSRESDIRFTTARKLIISVEVSIKHAAKGASYERDYMRVDWYVNSYIPHR
jgi:hypothetical protein